MSSKSAVLEAPGDNATPEEVDAWRAHQAEIRMEADGIATVTTIPVDYFGVDEINRVTLPDGLSWVEHKTLTEGDRRKYLNKINRDVRVQKATGDAVMKLAPGDERYELLKTAISGWNLTRSGSPIAFSTSNLDLFLNNANPKVVDLIEKAVRLANPWLLSEVSIEDIDREIETLTELRAKKVAEEEGKGTSSTK